jgi:hypothetical protein
MKRRKFYIPKDEHTRYYHHKGDPNPIDYGYCEEVEDEDSTTA